MANTIDDIEFFFTRPMMPPETHARGNELSILYLLRRELVETQGYDPNRDDESLPATEGARNRLFASLSLMFIGMDLLAKFHQGDDPGKVGVRYIEFLSSLDGGGQSLETAKLLYSVRNSLLHSFGVPDEKTLKKLQLKNIAIVQRRIVPTTLGPQSVTVTSNGDFVEVFIDGIYRVFLNSINRYRASLFGSDADVTRTLFERMFAKYGTIRMMQT